MAKAIGECVERYCSAIFDYRDLTLAPYRELTRRATHPGSFALYRPDQFGAHGFPWQPFTVDTPVLWTSGLSLVDGEETLVPAAMVYVPFHYLRSRRDTPVAQPISTGLASGCSFAEAALGGLCEVVERDAFTLTWQASMSRPVIRPETLPAAVADLVARFADVGIDVHLVDITTDLGLPTVLTVALGRATTSPALAVAAATDPSSEVAAVKSLEELAHTRKFARQLMDYTPEVPVEVEDGHPQVTGQRDHLRFYCPRPATAYAEFMWSSPEGRDLGRLGGGGDGGDGGVAVGADPGADLAAAVRSVAAAGLDVIACDLTTPDIRALGLSVVGWWCPAPTRCSWGTAPGPWAAPASTPSPRGWATPGCSRAPPTTPTPTRSRRGEPWPTSSTPTCATSTSC
jgi:ribosomal protein S12 methylthiotransferase accessory factor